MPPSSIGAHISKSCDVAPHLALQFVLNPHGRQLRVEVEDLLCAQLAQFTRRMDVEAGHEPRRDMGPDAVEEFQGALFVFGLAAEKV